MGTSFRMRKNVLSVLVLGDVSGASSGIGAATAKLFARLGAQVSLTGRNETNLQLTADNCAVDGKKVLGLTHISCNGAYDAFLCM